MQDKFNTKNQYLSIRKYFLGGVDGLSIRITIEKESKSISFSRNHNGQPSVDGVIVYSDDDIWNIIIKNIENMISITKQQ